MRSAKMLQEAEALHSQSAFLRSMIEGEPCEVPVREPVITPAGASGRFPSIRLTDSQVVRLSQIDPARRSVRSTIRYPRSSSSSASYDTLHCDPSIPLARAQYLSQLRGQIDLIMCCVVAANIVVLGLETAFVWAGWMYLDILFTVVFVAELFGKLAISGCRVHFCHSSDHLSNIFDGLLAIFG